MGYAQIFGEENYTGDLGALERLYAAIRIGI
jgi:hypothetical protein